MVCFGLPDRLEAGILDRSKQASAEGVIGGVRAAGRVKA